MRNWEGDQEGIAAICPFDASSSLKVYYATFEKLILKRGILHKTKISPEGDERAQLVVPAKLRLESLQLAHESAGHFGTQKSFLILQMEFYRPRFYRDVQDFSKSCQACQINKSVPHPKWPLKPVDHHRQS